jgi:polysaccharide pyruvyl transferase WcaK-like protein
LPRFVDRDHTIHNLEIRRFYKNYRLPDKAYFDEDFAHYANEFDLLVIGGGGFLDFWVQNSETGTTLDISNSVLDKLKVPLMILSVGCIPHHEIPEGNLEKFKNFLDALLARKNTFVAVRNDGSKGVLKDYLGSIYEQAVPEVLDHGFYYQNDGQAYLPSRRPYVLINTTLDQVDMVNLSMGKIDKEKYAEGMRQVIRHLIANTAYNVVFAPHIYRDLQAIQLLLDGIDDFAIRSRIVITPYVQGDEGCNQVFSAYKNARLVLGMRFHANVCSIAMGVPSIGIAALDRVSSMYRNLGLSEWVVSPGDDLRDKLINQINALDATKNHEVNTTIVEERKDYCIGLYRKAYTRFL